MSSMYDPHKDWMRVRSGDRVVDVDEPRHVGRVVAIGRSITVEWEETRWRTELSFESVRFASRYNMHRRLDAKGGIQ